MVEGFHNGVQDTIAVKHYTTQLGAIDKSIKHWNTNKEARNYFDVKIGPKDCALCTIHFHEDIVTNEADKDTCCFGCPIQQVTGEQYCHKTPYRYAHNHKIRWRINEEGYHEQGYTYDSDMHVEQNSNLCTEMISFLYEVKSTYKLLLEDAQQRDRDRERYGQ